MKYIAPEQVLSQRLSLCIQAIYNSKHSAVPQLSIKSPSKWCLYMDIIAGFRIAVHYHCRIYTIFQKPPSIKCKISDNSTLRLCKKISFPL